MAVKAAVKGGGSGRARGTSFGRSGSWVLLALPLKSVAGVAWVLGAAIILVSCFK